MMIALIISTIITLIFPILAIPFNFFGIVFSSGTYRKYYCFLLAFSLAVLAYVWVPNSTMDLFRFHQQMGNLVGFDFEQLGAFLGENLEPAHYLVEFVVAQTGDYNLLQFLVVLCGYFELFWIISDYSEARKVGRRVFVLLFLYVVSSLRFIDFASGLWFNLAVINVAVGVYLSYFRKTKHIQYLFYVLAACLHIGVLYMLIVMILISKIKTFRKIRFSVVVALLLVVATFGVIVFILNSVFEADSSFMIMVNKMYNDYFVSYGSRGGLDYYLRVITMSLGLIMAIWYSKFGDLKEYGSFVAYFSIYVLATLVNAGIFSRYGLLLAILSMPCVEYYLKTTKDRHMCFILIAIIVGLSACRIASTCEQIESSDIIKQIKSNVTNSFFEITCGNGDKL